jgi:energy-coupling factor transporter ATP-binding protein EcfA2
MSAPHVSIGTLSTEPPSTLMESFKNFAAAHPLLVEAKDRLWEAILESAPNSLIIVSGPTGVGKTTLLARISQLLAAEMRDELEANPGRLPVVRVEATPPESRSFSWRGHFKRLLLEMSEPLVDYKRRLNPAGQVLPVMPPFPNDRGVTADYHYAVEQALRYRRPRAVLIDEAQHLFSPASGRRLEDQLNVVKSLANRSHTVHVLCGTYELLRIRNLSGQLSRRSIDIHFPRYDATKASDRRNFIKVLQTFAEQLPLAELPELAKLWEYFYERSIGCVGILKDWLVKGVSTALRGPSPSLTLKHLERHALSISQCDRLIEEATRGEAQFREDAGARSRLLLRLGLASHPGAAESKNPSDPDRPRQQQPGQRCPRRDPIGGEVAIAHTTT